ncbi:hypothetical protein R3W88_023008 [Solanum pinnatisectum]|uniref:Uncharacterized protein n=1 Tax=Solanum pinnatisectum TaxID=50273 RepID=A0AAV9LZ91_9SOLN|nr:hypothetical protein R3W88_023008 [Solanum pinnatisectum]
MRRVGVQKKLIKGEYQLLFEFVNKVLLPRTEKRIVASATDLFIMESLEYQLKHELEEITVCVSNKDVEISLIKAELLKEQSEGPGTAEVNELRKKNDVLKAQNVAIQEKLIKDNDEANARLTLVIKFLSHQPPSS